MSGAQLTASLVLKGDASGVVGAAGEGSAALDKLGASAAAAGTAGGAMAVPYNAAAVAVTAQAAASDLASKALSASGAAKVEEIARLTQMASASQATTANIVALSAAHGQYNSTVNAARALLASSVITQAEYSAAVEGAASKLTLANVVHNANASAVAKEAGGAAALTAAQKELGEGAEETGLHIEGLTRQLEHVGVASGLGMGYARLLVDGFRDLAAAAATPVGALVLVGAAAIAGAAAAEIYEISINKLNVAFIAHGDVLKLGTADYVSLAASISAAADVSQREGRAIVEDFVDAGAQSAAAVKTASESVQGYAVLSGQTADAAAKNIARMFTDPGAAIDELNKQYELLDAAQTQAIKNMQAQGDTAGAQEAVMDALKNKVSGLTDQTTSLGRAWDGVAKAASNALDAIGGWFAAHPNPFTGGFGMDGSLAAPGSENVQVDPAALARREADQASYNQLSNTVAGVAGNYNHEAERQQIQDEIDTATALKNEATNATDLKNANNALAYAKQQLADLDKKDFPDKQKLDDEDRAHLDTIKHLIDAAPEQIELSADHTVALQKEADASDGTALSIRSLANAYDVQKTIQPYTTALEYARQELDRGKLSQDAYATSVTKLNADIAAITTNMKAQQAAQAELTAKDEVRTQFTALTKFYQDAGDAIVGYGADQDSVFAKSKEILNLDIAAAEVWRDHMLADSAAVDDAQHHLASEIQDIYNNKIAKAYSDNLARAHDWGSGVESALRQMTDATQDWAKTSSTLVTGFSTEFEDTLVKMVEGGKGALTSFFQWIEEQLLKLVYQQYMASFFNGIFGQIVGDLGNIFGSAGGGTSGGGLFGTGHLHEGGVVGRDVSFVREVPAALFASAAHFHSGGPILAPGEVPIIAQAGELVLTGLQQATIGAALSRPIVVQLPANTNSAPAVTVNVHNNHPDAKVSSGKPQRNQDGSFSLDVMVESIDKAMAQRSKYGRSAFTNSLETTHGIKRSPFG